MDDIYTKKRIWQAIRKKCVDCSGGYTLEANKCILEKCPLYPYRYGKAIPKKERS